MRTLRATASAMIESWRSIRATRAASSAGSAAAIVSWRWYAGGGAAVRSAVGRAVQVGLGVAADHGQDRDRLARIADMARGAERAQRRGEPARHRRERHPRLEDRRRRTLGDQAIERQVGIVEGTTGAPARRDHRGRPRRRVGRRPRRIPRGRSRRRPRSRRRADRRSAAPRGSAIAAGRPRRRGPAPSSVLRDPQLDQVGVARVDLGEQHERRRHEQRVERVVELEHGRADRREDDRGDRDAERIVDEGGDRGRDHATGDRPGDALDSRA